MAMDQNLTPIISEELKNELLKMGAVSVSECSVKFERGTELKRKLGDLKRKGFVLDGCNFIYAWYRYEPTTDE